MTAPLRRTPLQDRSTERVDRIVEACATLLDEVDYHDLNTTLLAERSGMSVGAIYRFFSDKRAVVAELVRRYVDAFLDRATEIFDAAGSAEWTDATSQLVDAFVDLRRTRPGFRVVQDPPANIGDREAAGDENDLTDHLAELVATRFGLDLDDAFRHRMAVAVTMGNSLVSLAFWRDPTGDERVIADAKAVIQAYLTDDGERE